MRRHGLIWIVITTFVFLLAPLLVQPTAYQSVIDTELNAAAQCYDDSEVVRIVQNADSL
jgi:hypothetical protein